MKFWFPGFIFMSLFLDWNYVDVVFVDVVVGGGGDDDTDVVVVVRVEIFWNV